MAQRLWLAWMMESERPLLSNTAAGAAAAADSHEERLEVLQQLEVLQDVRQWLRHSCGSPATPRSCSSVYCRPASVRHREDSSHRWPEGEVSGTS